MVVSADMLTTPFEVLERRRATGIPNGTETRAPSTRKSTTKRNSATSRSPVYRIPGEDKNGSAQTLWSSLRRGHGLLRGPAFAARRVDRPPREKSTRQPPTFVGGSAADHGCNC